MPDTTLHEPVKPAEVLAVGSSSAELDRLEQWLQGPGLVLIKARSAAEALERACAHSNVAVALVDLRMSGADGVQTLRLMREQLALQDKRLPPAVMMGSPNTERSLLLRAYGEGAVDWLVKPLDPDLLRAKVALFVDLHRRSTAEQSRIESALRLYNEMLLQARDRTREASEAKSQFLARISHELRTPLNAILGYAELLHEDLVEQGRREWATDVARIHLAAEHLLGVVNGILDLAKVEAGRMEIHMEEFEVEPLVRRVAEGVSNLAERRANKLFLAADPGVGTMRSDAAKVRQILYNLLSNAVKFTHGGTIRIHVSRDRGSEADCIVFQVEDNGIGIAPEQFPQLFREFTQLASDRTLHLAGTGLGLTICERFCRLLGGAISVESNLGAGSTFTVRLPANVTQGECLASTGYSPT